MFEKAAALIRGEMEALKAEIGHMREQVREIAAWLGISPIDAGLGVATLSGVLALAF